MKAPDNIYIEQYSDGVFSTEWHKYTHSAENTIAHEYLCKDALLEWAKDMKHVYELPLNGRGASKICLSKAEAFQMVIDKLNQM